MEKMNLSTHKLSDAYFSASLFCYVSRIPVCKQMLIKAGKKASTNGNWLRTGAVE